MNNEERLCKVSQQKWNAASDILDKLSDAAQTTTSSYLTNRYFISNYALHPYKTHPPLTKLSRKIIKPKVTLITIEFDLIILQNHLLYWGYYLENLGLFVVIWTFFFSDRITFNIVSSELKKWANILTIIMRVNYICG